MSELEKLSESDRISRALRIELRYDDVVEPDIRHRASRSVQECETCSGEPCRTSNISCGASTASVHPERDAPTAASGVRAVAAKMNRPAERAARREGSLMKPVRELEPALTKSAGNAAYPGAKCLRVD